MASRDLQSLKRDDSRLSWSRISRLDDAGAGRGGSDRGQVWTQPNDGDLARDGEVLVELAKTDDDEAAAGIINGGLNGAVGARDVTLRARGPSGQGA